MDKDDGDMPGEDYSGFEELVKAESEKTASQGAPSMTIQQKADRFQKVKGEMDRVANNLSTEDEAKKATKDLEFNVNEVMYGHLHPLIRMGALYLVQLKILPSIYEQKADVKIMQKRITVYQKQLTNAESDLKTLTTEQYRLEKIKSGGLEASQLSNDLINETKLELQGLNQKYIELKTNGFKPGDLESPDSVLKQGFEKLDYMRSLERDHADCNRKVKNSVRGIQAIDDRIKKVTERRYKILEAMEIAKDYIESHTPGPLKDIKDEQEFISHTIGTVNDATKINERNEKVGLYVEAAQKTVYGQQVHVPTPYQPGPNSSGSGTSDVKKRMEDNDELIKNLAEGEKVRGFLQDIYMK